MQLNKGLEEAEKEKMSIMSRTGSPQFEALQSGGEGEEQQQQQQHQQQQQEEDDDEEEGEDRGDEDEEEDATYVDHDTALDADADAGFALSPIDAVMQQLDALAGAGTDANAGANVNAKAKANANGAFSNGTFSDDSSLDVSGESEEAANALLAVMPRGQLQQAMSPGPVGEFAQEQAD